MIDKKTLRNNNRILRRKLTEGGLIEIASFNIIEKIKNWDLYKSSKNIMIFYPLAEEINLLPLIEDKNKNFYLPKCTEDNSLTAHLFKSEEKLVENKFKIKEPINEPINPEILDIVFLPALGADKFRNRIGYGKGYYDRFLAFKNIKAKKVLIIQSALISDVEIKADEFDIKYDYLISDDLCLL